MAEMKSSGVEYEVRQLVRGFEPAEVAAGLTLFEQCRTEVIAGQYLDLNLAADTTADEETARRVALLKSARYTVTTRHPSHRNGGHGRLGHDLKCVSVRDGSRTERAAARRKRN